MFDLVSINCSTYFSFPQQSIMKLGFSTIHINFTQFLFCVIWLGNNSVWWTLLLQFENQLTNKNLREAPISRQSRNWFTCKIKRYISTVNDTEVYSKCNYRLASPLTEGELWWSSHIEPFKGHTVYLAILSLIFIHLKYSLRQNWTNGTWSFWVPVFFYWATVSTEIKSLHIDN